jgi:hypothetical protein
MGRSHWAVRPSMLAGGAALLLVSAQLHGLPWSTLEITGTIVLSDPTPDASDLAATATLNNLRFAFTSPDANRT